NEQECEFAVREDPECSKYFYFQNPTNGANRQCWCYTKNPCCKTCSRRNAGSTWTLYELETTPDPTCSTGVLSEDGNYCCSGTCGKGNCVASGATAQPFEGMCNT